MENINTENYKIFKHLIDQSGNTYSYNNETAGECLKALIGVIKDMGFNPMITDELKKGIMTLFNIEILNLPDLTNNRFIFTPNHVSDFDAVVLGLLHPRIRIVAKNDWTSDERLKPFLDAHYDLYGLDRSSLQSLWHLLTDSIKYFNDDDVNKHFLVFSQGTISDFNKNSPERISPLAQKLSNKTNVPIVNVFVEQVSIFKPTRIVFDEPMNLSPRDDFRNNWLEREMAMQNALVPPARMPELTEKHANNNKPGDPFF